MKNDNSEIITKLTDINDRWTRSEVLKTLVENPTKENLSLVEKSINSLLGNEFKPYKKSMGDQLDFRTACDGILYYARTNVFKNDPYAVQAMIPFVWDQPDLISLRLRGMQNGDWYFTVYQLLEAQLLISDKLN